MLSTHCLEGRDSLAALRYNPGTAGMETAAWWWVQRGGHFSLQDNALTRFFEKWVGYGYR